MIYRIGQNKHTIGTWQQVADVLNDLLGLEYDESTYRKQFRKLSKAIDNYQHGEIEDAPKLRELEIKQREFEKAKIRYRDERLEYNKQNRIEARLEQRLDYLEEQFKTQGRLIFPSPIVTTQSSETNSTQSMLITLSDLHIGMCFDTYFGKYNSTIAKERLGAYLTKIKEIAKTHNIRQCYVAILGDVISGNIHSTIAISNRENVIDQIKLATEYITSFCYELTQTFDEVYVRSVSGNHSRITKKEEAVHSERLDDLIAWTVGAFLSHIENFHYCKNTYDDGIANFIINGKEYVCVHGDFDVLNKTGVANLSMMLGHIPYAVVCGHRHFNAFSDEGRIKIIQSGSLASVGDDYTIEKRLTGGASQAVCICSDDGVECMYNIQLS